MHRRAFTSGFLLLVAATALVVAPGCRRQNAHAPAPVPEELSELYARISEARHDYERGLELSYEGSDAAGRDLLAAASARLRAAARACSITPGCDASLLDATLVHVYRDRVEPLPSLVEECQCADDDGAAGECSPEDTTPQLPPITASSTLLLGREFVELIPWNDSVRAALHDWLTWKRPRVHDAWENYQLLRPHAAPAYVEAGLPEALLFALMAKESGGKAHAYSRAGAAGALQFMPATALRYGLGSDDGFDLRLDPVASAKASARYLLDQLEAFDGDLEMTLAAYNGGESKLRRLARRHPDASFWDEEIQRELQRETKRYVPQVLAAAWLFLHAEEYGVHLPELEAETSEIVLEVPASLGELTICLGEADNPGGWFRTLRNLNPRLDSTRRIPARTRVRIPAIVAREFAERCTGSAPLFALARELQASRYPETEVAAADSGTH